MMQIVVYDTLNYALMRYIFIFILLYVLPKLILLALTVKLPGEIFEVEDWLFVLRQGLVVNCIISVNKIKISARNKCKTNTSCSYSFTLF